MEKSLQSVYACCSTISLRMLHYNKFTNVHMLLYVDKFTQVALQYKVYACCFIIDIFMFLRLQ